jgi:hypothetical protein
MILKKKLKNKSPHDRAHLITAQKRPPTTFLAFGMFHPYLITAQRRAHDRLQHLTIHIPYNHTKEGSMMTSQTLIYPHKRGPMTVCSLGRLFIPYCRAQEGPMTIHALLPLKRGPMAICSRTVRTL